MTRVEPAVSRTTTVAVVTAAAIASATGLFVSLWAATSTGGSLLDPVLGAVVVASLTVTGAVVAFSRPANRVGWTMLAAGTLWAVGDAGVDAARAALVGDRASALAVAGSVARGIAWWLLVLGLPLWFPDGRLAGPRWRWLPRGFVAVVVASAVGTLTAADANLVGVGAWRNPLALPDSLQPISGALSLGSLAGAVVVTIGSVRQLVARWRAGDALRRQQLRLFVAAAALPVVVGPVALITGAGGWLFDVAALPLPFAVAFAVLARGLYDLRTAVNRTLVWVVLSATVAGFYALVLAGVGARFDVSGAAWLPWLAAAVVAVTFAPLRDGLQRAVNRVTFGRWDDPYAVLSGLVRALEASAGADAVLQDVVDELGSLGLDGVEIRDAQEPLRGRGARCRDGRCAAGRLRAVRRDPALPPPGLAPARPGPGPARRPGPTARGRPARPGARRRRAGRPRTSGAGPRGGASPAAPRPARRARTGPGRPPAPARRDRRRGPARIAAHATTSSRCGTTCGRRCSTCGGSSRVCGRRHSTSSGSAGRSSRRAVGSPSERAWRSGSRWERSTRSLPRSRSPRSGSRPRR